MKSTDRVAAHLVYIIKIRKPYITTVNQRLKLNNHNLKLYIKQIIMIIVAL